MKNKGYGDISISIAEMQRDISYIKERVDGMTLKVNTHEEKLNNLNLTIAKWIGAFTVIIFVLQVVINYFL